MMEKAKIIYPVACTYIRSGECRNLCGIQINRKFGLGDAVIAIKNTPEPEYARMVYLKFDISGLDVENGMYLRAFFPFIRNQDKAGSTLALYKTDSDWNPENVTWENRPAEAGLLASGIGFVADLTEAVKDARAKGEMYLSIRLACEQVTPSEMRTTNPTIAGTGPYMEYSDTAGNVEFCRHLSEDEEENEAIWARAKSIVEDWMTGGKTALYAIGQKDAFHLEKLDITSPSGSHSVMVEGCQTGNPPTRNFRKYYARTLDSLISVDGYSEDRCPVCEYDAFGGIVNFGFTGKATGFFHTEERGERTYIIDPLGNPFFAVGINHFNMGATENNKKYNLERYGTSENYWKEITAKMTAMGFNSATGSADAFMATETPLNAVIGIHGITSYMRALGLSTSTGGSSSFANNNTMNVFDPEFQAYSEEKNRDLLLRLRENPHVLGYTSDNELPTTKNLLENYLLLDCGCEFNLYSYATAWTWLIAVTGKSKPSICDITDEMREEFKAFVFGRLLGIARSVIDKYDGNHMYLGTRANGGNRDSEGYLRAAGYNCDVLTINMYGGIQPSTDVMTAIRRYSGKPFIVTEFYSKAEDSYDMNGKQLGNQENAGWLVHTQIDRTYYLENYITLLIECKYCVGWLWFCFQDNDQSLYYPSETDHSKVLRVWQKGARYAVVSFVDDDYRIYPATGEEVKFYAGDTDTSALGSNKGVVDGFTEVYEPLRRSFIRLGRNLAGLIDFFDEKNKNTNK